MPDLCAWYSSRPIMFVRHGGNPGRRREASFTRDDCAATFATEKSETLADRPPSDLSFPAGQAGDLLRLKYEAALG